MTNTDTRKPFMPIAILEHHQMVQPVLSDYDISDRLEVLWPEIKREAEAKTFSLDSGSILDINKRVAQSLGIEGVEFHNTEGWASFVIALTDCGTVTIDDDPPHMCSWIFSKLYWNHLVKCRLATAWFFTNALRVQHDLPEYRLTLAKLGYFLESLSGAGPPIYDGQTFYPELYSE